MRKKGFVIPVERIISSGSLIKNWVDDNHFAGARFYVLGPESTMNLVRTAGGVVVPPESEDCDVLVLGHQNGYPFVERVEHALSLFFKAIAAGKPIRVLVPNPDLIYPKTRENFGFTAGILGLIFQESMKMRFPDLEFNIEYLGKPYSPIFDEAKRRANSSGKMVMIGDQLHTDVKGANDAGIDSVLIGSGVTELKNITASSPIKPTYIMHHL